MTSTKDAAGVTTDDSYDALSRLAEQHFGRSGRPHRIPTSPPSRTPTTAQIGWYPSPIRLTALDPPYTPTTPATTSHRKQARQEPLATPTTSAANGCPCRHPGSLTRPTPTSPMGRSSRSLKAVSHRHTPTTALDVDQVSRSPMGSAARGPTTRRQASPRLTTHAQRAGPNWPTGSTAMTRTGELRARAASAVDSPCPPANATYDSADELHPQGHDLHLRRRGSTRDSRWHDLQLERPRAVGSHRRPCEQHEPEVRPGGRLLDIQSATTTTAYRYDFGETLAQFLSSRLGDADHWLPA